MRTFRGELFVVFPQRRFCVSILGKYCPYGGRASENGQGRIVRDASKNSFYLIKTKTGKSEELE